MQTFSITLTPRQYETDSMGHINNASIAAWFEVVRVRFLESVIIGGPALGGQWILASVHLDYVGETFYGSDVTASIESAEIGNTSLTLVMAMEQDGRPTVKGYAVLVQIEPDTRQPVRIGDDIRARVENA